MASSRFGLVTAAALLACGAARAGSGYTFTTIDGPGNNGGGTTINGVNNNGALVGFSSAAGGFLLTNFVRSANGTFTAMNIGNDPLAMANGINNANTVVGVTSFGTAFSLAGGIFTSLPQPNPGNTTSSAAFGINDKGVIVGQYADSSTFTTPGTVFRAGQYTILNPLPTAAVTNAQGINNLGRVVGFYSTDGVHQHGFTFNATTNAFTLLPDPNDAIIAKDGLVLTQFLGINDQNEAVGYYQTNNGSQHGFLFDVASQTYTFLDDPLAAPVNGVEVTQITGINDRNEIVGFYVDANGVQHGFLATVPEPTGLTLAGLAAACLTLRAWRARRPHGCNVN